MYEFTPAGPGKMNGNDVNEIYQRIINNITTLINESYRGSDRGSFSKHNYDVRALFYGTPYHIIYTENKEKGMGGRITYAKLKIMHIPSETEIIRLESRDETPESTG